MGVRDDIVRYAQRQIGCAYSYIPSGGTEGKAYNCSFLTTCAYRAAGITVPRWQGHQNGDGSQSDWVRRAGHWTTKPSELKPGDLVFFGTSPTNTSHVGISLGGNRMIDSVPDGGVQERRLYASFVGGGWPLTKLPENGPTPSLPSGVIAMQTTVVLSHDTNIRANPSTSATICGVYSAGSKVNIDGLTFGGGLLWGTYVGSNSGKRRYIWLGEASNVR